mmetsp:Transcript_8955/g.24303  ORF Transcript_8955/g.24303 Transcript_8955/m.24303 type:complete len:236 (+) Transcript_8955:192-899(+)
MWHGRRAARTAGRRRLPREGDRHRPQPGVPEGSTAAGGGGGLPARAHLLCRGRRAAAGHGGTGRGGVRCGGDAHPDLTHLGPRGSAGRGGFACSSRRAARSHGRRLRLADLRPPSGPRAWAADGPGSRHQRFQPAGCDPRPGGHVASRGLAAGGRAQPVRERSRGQGFVLGLLRQGLHASHRRVRRRRRGHRRGVVAGAGGRSRRRAFLRRCQLLHLPREESLGLRSRRISSRKM